MFASLASFCLSCQWEETGVIMLEYIRWYSLGKALHVSLPKQRDMGDENALARTSTV
jgi:hypothetical protein